MMENETESLFSSPEFDDPKEEPVAPQESVEESEPVEETPVERVEEKPQVVRYDLDNEIDKLLAEGVTKENIVRYTQEVAFETAKLFFTKDPNMLKLESPLKVGYLDLKHRYEDTYDCKIEEEEEAEEDSEIPESSPFAGVFAKKFDPKLLDDVLDTVFVAPLLLENTEAVIHRLFEGCGNIVEIKKDTGNFAFVKFEDPDSVDLALKKDGTRVDDMIISVELPKLSKHVSVYSLVISNIPYVEGDPKKSWTKEDAEKFVVEGIHNEIYRMQRESDYSRFVNCGNTLAPIISKWPYDLKFYPTKKEMIRTSQTKVNHKYAKIVFKHWSYAFFALKCLDGKEVNDVAVEIYPIAKFKKRSVHNIVLVREIPESWSVHDIKTAFGDFGMIGMIQKLPTEKNDYEVHFIDISAAKQILGVASKNGGYIDLGKGQSPNVSIRVERVPKRMKFDGNFHISGFHHSGRNNYGRRGYYGRRYQRGGRGRGYQNRYHQNSYGQNQGYNNQGYSQQHHMQHHHRGGYQQHHRGYQQQHTLQSHDQGMGGGGVYGHHQRRTKTDDNSLYRNRGGYQKNYYDPTPRGGRSITSGTGGGFLGGDHLGGGGMTQTPTGYGSSVGSLGRMNETNTRNQPEEQQQKDYSSYYQNSDSTQKDGMGQYAGAGGAGATGAEGADDFNEKRYYTNSYGNTTQGGGNTYGQMSSGFDKFGGVSGGGYDQRTSSQYGRNSYYDRNTGALPQNGGGAYEQLHAPSDKKDEPDSQASGSDENKINEGVYHEPSTDPTYPYGNQYGNDNRAAASSTVGRNFSQSNTDFQSGGFVNQVDNLPSPEASRRLKTSSDGEGKSSTLDATIFAFSGKKDTSAWAPVATDQTKESTGEGGD